MDHLKERLALLQDDLNKLLKEVRSSSSAIRVQDLKAVLKLSRDLESFAIGQIALKERDAKKR